MLKSNRVKKGTVLLSSTLTGLLLLITVIYGQHNNDKIPVTPNHTHNYLSSNLCSSEKVTGVTTSVCQTKKTYVTSITTVCETSSSTSVAESVTTNKENTMPDICVTDTPEVLQTPEVQQIPQLSDNAYISEIIQPQPENPQEQNADIELTFLGTFESTAYTWTGCRCASGNYPYSCLNADGINYRTVAVDSSIIALGTRLYIEAGDYSGFVIAEDTGGAINGNIIDLYMDGYDECINWGRRDINVYILS